VNGIDPARLNPASRFGAAFYVSESPETALAEVAAHGGAATNGIRFAFDASSANVLDLTNPEVAGAWGYSGGPITADTIGIGTKASEAGFDAIRFWSERGVGANWAILDNFSRLLSPQMITPIP
jgi:RES domain-containing protein